MPSINPHTEAKGASLLYVIGLCFFAMVLLAPYMTIAQVSQAEVSYTGEGSALRQIVYLCILVASVTVTLRGSMGWRPLLLPWPLIIALIWCWASIYWAIDRSIAVRRLTLTTIAVWNTFIIFQALGYKRTLSVVRVTFTTLLLVNYLAVLLEPGLGTHAIKEASEGNTAIIGNWRGIMGHKNVAGATCAVTIMIYVFDASKIKSYTRFLVISAAAYFLFKTQSKTSVGMIVMALLSGFIFHYFDQRVRSFAIPISLFLTASVWFVYNAYSTLLLTNLYNPSLFTGRGKIWAAMLKYSSDNLLFGSGFGSFWNIGTNSPIFDYAKDWVRDVATGHNGYLDLLVQIGAPGLSLVLFSTLVWPVWCLLTRSIVAERGALSVALLLFCMGHNITESSVLERDSVIGVVMMISVAIAVNWKIVGLQAQAKSVTAAELFAKLAQRRGEIEV